MEGCYYKALQYQQRTGPLQVSLIENSKSEDRKSMHCPVITTDEGSKLNKVHLSHNRVHDIFHPITYLGVLGKASVTRWPHSKTHVAFL